MKKGKTAKIIGFADSKVTYGTVDSKELKSVYLNLQSWVSPKDDSENWERLVSNFGKAIKSSIYEELNRDLFKEKYIVDLDLRSSGIVVGKKSFMNLEITFFLNKEIDFKDNKLKDSLRQITRRIYLVDFKKNKHFEFTLSKKNKEVLS